MTATLPTDRCIRCTGTDDLVKGDGPMVCNGCVDLLTGAAMAPYVCSDKLLTQILHDNPYVKLARTADESHELVWEWMA